MSSIRNKYLKEKTWNDASQQFSERRWVSSCKTIFVFMDLAVSGFALR
jgi:hypothetical protein